VGGHSPWVGALGRSPWVGVGAHCGGGGACRGWGVLAVGVPRSVLSEAAAAELDLFLRPSDPSVRAPKKEEETDRGRRGRKGFQSSRMAFSRMGRVS